MMMFGMLGVTVLMYLALSANADPIRYSNNNNNENEWWEEAARGGIRGELLLSNASVTSDSCVSHATCEECSTTYLCHWCGDSLGCHVRGSVYGCFRGESCGESNNKKKKNDTDPSGCGAHRSCEECGLSTFCHWCGHDNACHAKASPYGCVTGVDCFSNDRCKRNQAEPLPAAGLLSQVPLMAQVLMGVVAAILLCCTSFCYCVAGGIKGAYDDLANIATTNNNASTAGEQEPLLGTAETSPETSMPHPEEESQAITTASESEQVHENGGEEDAVEAGDYEALEDTAADAEPSVVTSSANAETPVQTQLQGRPQTRHMQRMYTCCTVCYIVTALSIAGAAFGSVLLYPRMPEYNICNDAVAWKEVIDSLESLKLQADFQILASVSNPNYIDLALDQGSGSFLHDGNLVGTFEIPPTEAKALSITDILIVAHLKPEKWDTLSLVTEYEEGKLELSVDAQGLFRIPILFNYRFMLKLHHIQVRLNELGDRHLCACPTWKDAKNSSMLMAEALFPF